MQDTLIQQGMQLMAYGMGTVFVFLTVLVIATTIMSSLLQRFVVAKPPVQPGQNVPPSPTATAENDGQLVAVISAAIQKHRARHK
jgi:oxaloacetate decarboxylase gamma subunit